MNNQEQHFTVSMHSSLHGVETIGQLIVIPQDSANASFEFSFDSHNLKHTGPPCFDPVALPLPFNRTTIHFDSENLPGFIDDFLPDAWGYKVFRTMCALDGNNSGGLIDLISLCNTANIGAISIHTDNQRPSYSLGVNYLDLERVEHYAQLIDSDTIRWRRSGTEALRLKEQGFLGVGGARPKCLIEQERIGYLAKFNRPADAFNHARVEHACSLMARAAGINVCESKVESDINGHDVLLVKRFDARPNESRAHLISANALLKNRETFEDIGRSFKYDDVARLIRLYSTDPKGDLKQLVKLMLFNRVINNTDDHERNFSFLLDSDGFRLAPAYDLVPTPVFGAYHSASYMYSQNPPLPSQIIKSGSILGLDKLVAAEIAESVIDVIARWYEFSDQAGLTSKEAENFGRLFRV
jgi:serine/threonine-protein kinase HipA